VTPSSNETRVLGVLFEENAMFDRRWGSYVRVRIAPRCGPSPSALAPRDPSRSCTDLQSIEPPAVAARVASRLHLRPWLMWTLACSRRWSPRPGKVGLAPLMVLYPPSGTGRPASACPCCGRRGP